MSLAESFIQQMKLLSLIVPEMKHHYKNTPIKIYWEFYHQKKTNKKKKTKKKKRSDEKFWYSSYFCSKYRLWRGDSDEYPQLMFLSRNKKNNVYPCKPQFYCIKVGFKGGQNYKGMFSCRILKQGTKHATTSVYCNI